MCLAIPMQITEIDGYNARCAMNGVTRDVSLFLIQDEAPAVGDFVLVHVGYAIQTISEAEAETSWELFDAMLAAEDDAAAEATVLTGPLPSSLPLGQADA